MVWVIKITATTVLSNRKIMRIARDIFIVGDSSRDLYDVIKSGLHQLFHIHGSNSNRRFSEPKKNRIRTSS